MKYYYQNKNSFIEYFLLLLTFFSSIITYIIGELYFYTPNGTADYVKYEKYLSFFQYKSEYTESGQGLIYYYLVSAISYLRRNSVTNLNEINFLNANIHFTNFLIYSIGLIGFYYLLKKYGFSKSSIYISITAVNFCMPIFIMRAQLKPEVLAFGLLPWILLGLENYFEKPSIKNFLVPLFPITMVLSTKGSITGMVSLLLFLSFFGKLKKNLLIHLISFFILSFSFLLIFNENRSVNEYSVLEHNLSSEPQYDNSADFDFLTTIHKWDFYYFPIFPYHNNSAIGITLLDSYGDYFNVYTNYDANLFIYEKNDLFFISFEDEDQFNFGQFLPEYFSILFTFILFFSGFYFSYKNKNNFIYYLSPLIGVLILIVNAFGFPFNNFDPLVGDTLKTNYYSFLTGLTFIFIVASVFKKINVIKIFFLIMLSLIFFVVLGFPKEDKSKINFYLDEKIELSVFCPLIATSNVEKDVSDCFNIQKKVCEYNILSNNAREILNEELETLEIGTENPILFLDNNSKTFPINSISECKNQIKLGTEVYNPLFNNLRPLPIINLLNLIFSLFSILYLIKINQNKYNLN